MKKVLILLLMGVVLTGCTIKKLDINDINGLVSTSFINKNNLVNTVAVGYKYYLPKGVSVVDSSSYNEKLYYNGDYYYLYVDVVGDYNKIDDNYVINNNAYYSKILDCNGKKGHIEINKTADDYFIQATCNYSRMEAYVSEKNLNNSILNIGYILTSVDFNNPVTKLVVGTNEIKLGEEKFVLFKSTKSTGTFLDYVKEYDKYDKEIIDNDATIPNEFQDQSENDSSNISE